MGSTSDLPVMRKAADFLNSMQVPFEMLALSAHRTPDEVADFARGASARGVRVIIAGAGMLRLDNRSALRIYRRDRNLHKSPNAGQTESACAGALHIQLGGDASYFGKTVRKAAFGDPLRRVNRTDILATIDLMNAASVLALALCCAVKLTLQR